MSRSEDVREVTFKRDMAVRVLECDSCHQSVDLVWPSDVPHDTTTAFHPEGWIIVGVRTEPDPYGTDKQKDFCSVECLWLDVQKQLNAQATVQFIGGFTTIRPEDEKRIEMVLEAAQELNHDQQVQHFMKGDY